MDVLKLCHFAYKGGISGCRSTRNAPVFRRPASLKLRLRPGLIPPPASPPCLQTPSLVPPHLIAEILQALDSRFGIAAGAEVSLEADPGTFDLARLKQYTAMGVSRISMGVQAFDQVRS